MKRMDTQHTPLSILLQTGFGAHTSVSGWQTRAKTNAPARGCSLYILVVPGSAVTQEVELPNLVKITTAR